MTRQREEEGVVEEVAEDEAGPQLERRVLQSQLVVEVQAVDVGEVEVEVVDEASVDAVALLEGSMVLARWQSRQQSSRTTTR